MDSFLQVAERIEQNEGAANWIVGRQVAEWLTDFLQKIDAKLILEVGASIGYSGMWIARAVAEQGGEVVTIESHTDRRKDAVANWQEAGIDNIRLIPDHAPLCFERDTFDVVIEEVDVLFLDCIKLYYKQIFDKLADRMKSGSYILADNILSHKDALSDFVDAISVDDRFEVEILDIGTGVLQAKKL